MFGEVIRGKYHHKSNGECFFSLCTGEHVHIELIQLSGDYKGEIRIIFTLAETIKVQCIWVYDY